MTAERKLIVGEISGAIFLSKEFNEEIFHIAEALTDEPVARPSGFHQPFIPLWSAYAPNGMPKSFLDIFFDEFQDAYLPPLEFSGHLGILENGMVCVVFKEHRMINMIRAEIIRASTRFCEEIATIVTWEDVWAPSTFLGYGCKETPSLSITLSSYEKMLPERLAVGHLTKNYGFKRMMERSNKGQ